MSINKVLLAHSYAHSFTYGLLLLSHSNNGVEQLQLRQRYYSPQSLKYLHKESFLIAALLGLSYKMGGAWVPEAPQGRLLTKYPHWTVT